LNSKSQAIGLAPSVFLPNVPALGLANFRHTFLGHVMGKVNSYMATAAFSLSGIKIKLLHSHELYMHYSNLNGKLTKSDWWKVRILQLLSTIAFIGKGSK